jgi:two-component system, chemotaxis family, chemotaxis protein CheY
MAYTILITDDSATTRAIIKRTIQMAGVETKEVLEAPDGLKALEILKSRPIDLVFLDLNMPNMTGMELTAKVRADASLAQTKICIVSSESTASRLDQLRAQGVNGYIKKPFTPEQIRNVIGNILENKHAA